MSDAKQKPVKQYRRRAIGVSIWRREVPDGNGGTTTFYSATASRAFKPKEAGENDPFQYTDNFDADDLPIVAALLNMAYLWIVDKTNKDK